MSRPLQQGILLVNKPQGKTSFSLIRSLRKLTGIQKIGHAGTLDPFATGVMVILIGKEFTKLSQKLLCEDKEYLAKVCFGVSTDTYDCDGKVVASSKKIPSLEEVEKALTQFQGEIEQIPPMFSAKKIKGEKLYNLARQGIEVARPPCKVRLFTTLISYNYPHLCLKIECSKGTYIRSIAHELGVQLGCGAFLAELLRTRSGTFRLEDCVEGAHLEKSDFEITPYLKPSPLLH